MNIKEQIDNFLKESEEKSILIEETYTNDEIGMKTKESEIFVFKRHLLGDLELTRNEICLYIVCQFNKVRTITNIKEIKVLDNTLEVILLDTELIKSHIKITKGIES